MSDVEAALGDDVSAGYSSDVLPGRVLVRLPVVSCVRSTAPDDGGGLCVSLVGLSSSGGRVIFRASRASPHQDASCTRKLVGGNRKSASSDVALQHLFDDMVGGEVGGRSCEGLSAIIQDQNVVDEVPDDLEIV